MPEWSRISQIDASPHDAGTAYVAVDRHQLDDMHPYIYKTSDYGKTWTKLDNGIPDNTFVRAVREDPKKRGLLYAGTETGMYVSFNDGADWRSLQLNLPTTPVHDLVVKNNDLVLATHGRAFWILDDIGPLRQFTDDSLKTGCTSLRAVSGISHCTGPERTSQTDTVGQNPPPGAVIYYYRERCSQGRDGTWKFLTPLGKSFASTRATKPKTSKSRSIRTTRSRRKQIKPEAGLNRFVWDMRYEGATRVPDYYLFE